MRVLPRRSLQIPGCSPQEGRRRSSIRPREHRCQASARALDLLVRGRSGLLCQRELSMSAEVAMSAPVFVRSPQ